MKLNFQTDKIQSSIKTHILLNGHSAFSAKTSILSGVVETCASENIQVVTEAIVHAVTSFHPKIRYTLGWDANVIWIWLSRLPSKAGDFMKYHICKIEAPQIKIQEN